MFLDHCPHCSCSKKYTISKQFKTHKKYSLWNKMTIFDYNDYIWPFIVTCVSIQIFKYKNKMQHQHIAIHSWHIHVYTIQNIFWFTYTYGTVTPLINWGCCLAIKANLSLQTAILDSYTVDCFGGVDHGGHGFESGPLSFLLSTPHLFSISFPAPLFIALSIKGKK